MNKIRDTKDNEIINSIKRLDRIGAEDSKAIQKIKDAALNVARYVVANRLLDRLPGFTIYGDTLIDPHGKPIGRDMTRETALDFSRVIHQVKLLPGGDHGEDEE
ncbi:MAG: hypothetical protein CVV44_04015 [Spirochaetae bacterium HGW-Spirochaetae-1]|jgi:hypothetical protein|nr:MAG: hypothetical protein CVV44_04015 [Spirochaetae bacterium HGW-Spirochaetae-1]